MNLPVALSSGEKQSSSESAVPNDRVRAFALWEGGFGYDRKKYGAMLREGFEPSSNSARSARQCQVRAISDSQQISRAPFRSLPSGRGNPPVLPCTRVDVTVLWSREVV